MFVEKHEKGNLVQRDLKDFSSQSRCDFFCVVNMMSVRIQPGKLCITENLCSGYIKEI